MNAKQIATPGVVRIAILALAVAWAVVVFIVLMHYHQNEPVGVRSITTNGHTYYGDPPALTLLERDPVSFATIIIMGLGLIAATVDLTIRKLKNLGGWGTGSVIA